MKAKIDRKTNSTAIKHRKKSYPINMGVKKRSVCQQTYISKVT